MPLFSHLLLHQISNYQLKQKTTVALDEGKEMESGILWLFFIRLKLIHLETSFVYKSILSLRIILQVNRVLNKHDICWKLQSILMKNNTYSKEY